MVWAESVVVADSGVVVAPVVGTVSVVVLLLVVGSVVVAVVVADSVVVAANVVVAGSVGQGSSPQTAFSRIWPNSVQPEIVPSTICLNLDLIPEPHVAVHRLHSVQ